MPIWVHAHMSPCPYESMPIWFHVFMILYSAGSIYLRLLPCNNPDLVHSLLFMQSYYQVPLSVIFQLLRTTRSMDLRACYAKKFVDRGFKTRVHTGEWLVRNTLPIHGHWTTLCQGYSATLATWSLLAPIQDLFPNHWKDSDWRGQGVRSYEGQGTMSGPRRRSPISLQLEDFGFIFHWINLCCVWVSQSYDLSMCFLLEMRYRAAARVRTAIIPSIFQHNRLTGKVNIFLLAGASSADYDGWVDGNLVEPGRLL